MLAPVPYGLVVLGQEHECPLPEYKQVEWPVRSGLTLQKAQEENAQIWFVDGSSSFSAGKAKTVFGDVKVNTNQELKGPARPHSAQAAEVVAVLKILQEEVRKPLWQYLLIQTGGAEQ